MPAANVEERRAAIVLYLLGNEVSNAVFAALPDGQASRLQTVLSDFRQVPPPEDEVDDVVDEFERFMRFVGDGAPATASSFANAPPPGTPGTPGTNAPATGKNDGKSAAPPPEEEEDEEEEDAPKIFKISHNPMKQLGQLKPYQIAGALQQESPRAIAIVLGCVQAESAGEVLQYLPDDLRNNVVLELCESPTAPEALLTELVRTTVEKGIRLDQSAVTDASEKAIDRLADILRSMKRNSRNQLVAFLDTTRAETAGNIKKKLYVFDDLRAIAGRSLQKLLSRVESSTLASALNGADPDVKEKVLSNLSKRARSALEEEIEMAKDMTDDERAEGQRGICQVMAEMDQEGELAFEG